MPFDDLREFVDKLDKAGELARVRKEVDPKYEVGAICKMIHDKGRKALFFEKVRGCSMPVATELLGTFKRIAMAIDADETDLFNEVMERTKLSIEPTIVNDGPCKEIILKGKDVDLNRLPWITWNKTEKAPYITAGLVIVKDPEYGRNLGVYRMMYANRNQTFMRFRPGHHGYDFYRRAELRGEKKLEVA